MTVPVRRSSGLGRGLASLIPQRTMQGAITELPIARIVANPYQPRRRMRPEALESLAASIAEHGVLQPIVVSETLDGYQLIAGERRLRAAELAGRETIPAVVRQTIGHEQLELALVENLQRADLDAIEEAHAYRQLIDEFGLTHDEIGRRVGRSRASITNALRLLELPQEIQEAVIDGLITEGHARALAGAPPAARTELVAVIASRGLSVRQTEELARRLRDDTGAGPDEHASTEAGGPEPVPVMAARDADLDRLETELRDALGTKVTLVRSRRGGRIVIEFYDTDDLGRLYDRLVGGRQ